MGFLLETATDIRALFFSAAIVVVFTDICTYIINYYLYDQLNIIIMRYGFIAIYSRSNRSISCLHFWYAKKWKYFSKCGKSGLLRKRDPSTQRENEIWWRKESKWNSFITRTSECHSYIHFINDKHYWSK